MNIDPILNQGADLECIWQFLSNQEERALELVKCIPTEDILEELVDNFVPNHADKPLESS